jgi:hypothetical protein
MPAHGKPLEYFKIVGPKPQGRVIGTLDGKPFTELVIDDFGRTYRYAGVVNRQRNGRFAVEDLRTGEFLLDSGLVYKLNTLAPHPTALLTSIWRKFSS